MSTLPEYHLQSRVQSEANGGQTQGGSEAVFRVSIPHEGVPKLQYCAGDKIWGVSQPDLDRKFIHFGRLMIVNSIP